MQADRNDEVGPFFFVVLFPLLLLLLLLLLLRLLLLFHHVLFLSGGRRINIFRPAPNVSDGREEIVGHHLPRRVSISIGHGHRNSPYPPTRPSESQRKPLLTQ